MLVREISLIDGLISLLVIIFVVTIAYFIRPDSKKLYSKYYFPFIVAKISFAVLFVLIHVYYYKGGDTFLYFAGGNFFREQFMASPQTYFKIMFSSFEDIRNIYFGQSFDVFYAFGSLDVFFMSKALSVFNILTGGNYLASSILFTIVTAIGVWKLYLSLCNLYPRLTKLFAIGILFYPSLGIWGSGILKDPLTLACVGFIFSSTQNLIQKKQIVLSTLTIISSVLLCQILKPYILYTFIPVILLWVQGKINQNVSNSFLKFIITPIIILGFIGGGYIIIQSVSKDAGKYSIENVQSVAEGFNSWHTYLAETRNQSGYSLGTVEYTPTGILEKSPQAFFVTYYRPFIIGDVRNVATLFEAVQNLILLLLTIYILFKVNPVKFIKLVSNNPEIRAFLIFSITFGIAIGLTSYNFGALSRYKIPSLPFYVAFLIITYYEGDMKKKLSLK